MKSLSRSLLHGQDAKHNLRLGLRLAALLLSPAAAVQADWVGDTRPLMGTEVSVYLWSDDADQGRQAVDDVFAEAARIDRLMSTYKEDSEISTINRRIYSSPCCSVVS